MQDLVGEDGHQRHRPTEQHHEEIVRGLYRLRHHGHEIILFHILDEAEVKFPFAGLTEFEDVETAEKLEVDARGIRDDYLITDVFEKMN